MKNYLKLVSFEINRFLKIYIGLAALTVVVQFLVVLLHTQSYMKLVRDAMSNGRFSMDSFLKGEGPGPISMIDIMDGSYVIPIVICIAGLLIYSFLIWYRDWFGKNTFIYRLLMLPTERINIYLAKATAIFMMVLGLVALQLILLPVESKMLQLMVPIDFRRDMPINGMMAGFGKMNILFPVTFMDFFVHYGIGFMTVFVLFTSILLERCYRLKGMVFGAIYFILAMAVFLLPVFFERYTVISYFYPLEIFIIQLCLGLFITGISILLSHYLLQRKIRV
ncbi:hypothetical protein ACFSMW_12650 [Virgibacillus halophilus]|uniref:ABC-2 family transporter protein n=1 Tax=Tigheibacillus halophilus TaxID=361280 RepID=A0ABU5C7Q5_9BACI|nr:hypothetical protein [Virgibacillus halophilus]